jgi:hypothetical protein
VRTRTITLSRAGTVAVLLLTVGAVLIVVVSAALRLAADDLLATVSEARGGTASQPAHTPYGAWLARYFSTDIAPGDLDAENARGTELGYRSDRLREAAAVPALLGLLVALLTDTPSGAMAERRAASQPVANTTSNGTA